VVTGEIIDFVPDNIAIKRVHTQDQWLDHLFNDCAIGKGDIARAETLTPTGDAFICLNFDKMGGSILIELLGISQNFWQFILQNMAGDFGYFHWEAQHTFGWMFLKSQGLMRP
jgi:hypothetical protein